MERIIILCDNPYDIVKNYNVFLPHLTIMKNGSIKQHYNFIHPINFEINMNILPFFIGFENMTILDINTNVDIFNRKHITKAKFLKWKGWSGYDNYTDKQYITLNYFIKKLYSIYNIETSVTPNNLTTNDTFGIMSKSNFSSFFYDVNPLFNFKNIIL